MKKLTIGLISLALMATTAFAEVELQKTVKVELNVGAVITLDVTAPDAVVPGPEDYAQVFSAKNSVTTCSTAPSDDYGFADRSGAIKVTMFTNAKKGADVYFSALANPAIGHTLQVKDIYLTVNREKTYVLLNSTDGDADLDVTNGINGAWALVNTSIDGTAMAKWIQADNEAKQLFGVTAKTESAREWFLKLGIGGLAEYTQGSYDADITFTLIATVV